uniref:Uncharacterized protein n=1 Tax=Phage sp. ctPjm15 TaxID=2828006 RepID=A0A8S5SPM6_9VIRU|nr:MAG TPA: hypothetical protein [Phage sp. ctPjm15]DAY67870.1 MAG TPA: hypothetical protein [Caudoviricetes sp.]DAZ59822.1 MAG TPA: hypothetical protein [Caudoviricetes sp.]
MHRKNLFLLVYLDFNIYLIFCQLFLKKYLKKIKNT